MRRDSNPDADITFPYVWRLADIRSVAMPFHGRTVFSCFAGGGGSSMGYKLAGYDVVGACEIDEEMAACYEKNLKPKFMHRGDIRELVVAKTVPRPLRSLDVLDGSPPCTLFSTARMNKEEFWGKEKKFREGQKKQVLDTLFFDFITLAAKLRPKVVVAENVTGMLKGATTSYVSRIIRAFGQAGYAVGLHEINTAKMGLPQERLRIVFLALRDDLAGKVARVSGMFDRRPEIDMDFRLVGIPFSSVMETADSLGLHEVNEKESKMCKFLRDNWKRLPPGNPYSTIHPRGSFFNNRKIDPGRPVPTLTSLAWNHIHPLENRTLNVSEYRLCGTFPLDYDFMGVSPYYVIGMSVPPVMMAQVAWRVKRQWLDRIRTGRG